MSIRFSQDKIIATRYTGPQSYYLGLKLSLSKKDISAYYAEKPNSISLKNDPRVKELLSYIKGSFPLSGSIFICAMIFSEKDTFHPQTYQTMLREIVTFVENNLPEIQASLRDHSR